MWNGMNKRAFPRAVYPCKVKVIVRFFLFTFDTFTENIGIGGICVILDKKLNKFSDVDLEVFLSDGEIPIKCLGRVVWVVKRSQFLQHKPSQYDTGIEFVDIGSRDRARITALVDKLRQQEEREGDNA